MNPAFAWQGRGLQGLTQMIEREARINAVADPSTLASMIHFTDRLAAVLASVRSASGGG